MLHSSARRNVFRLGSLAATWRRPTGRAAWSFCDTSGTSICDSDVPGEGVEPPGNRSAVGHISRSVTPARKCASSAALLKLWCFTARAGAPSHSVPDWSRRHAMQGPSCHVSKTGRTNSFPRGNFRPCGFHHRLKRLLVWPFVPLPGFRERRNQACQRILTMGRTYRPPQSSQRLHVRDHGARLRRSCSSHSCSSRSLGCFLELETGHRPSPK